MPSLSHYEILEKLGEGGMGVVSLARDKRLGRLVALKQLRHEVCCGGALKERFLTEARTASSLNHPNIVTIYDIDSAGGSDIIAMEYVKGKRLDETINHRPLPMTEALDLAVQIACALEAAHQAGIVHRDIKPANIMVSETGLVKVLDFGLAKLVQRAPFSLTGETVTGEEAVSRPGEVSGTLYYMSPEQAEGRDVDARTDIFAFGCVLYEMLTGRRAFTGDSAARVLSAILRDDPPPLSLAAPGVPPELERIVRRCLRKDPRKRWQQMPDLRVALEELRDEGPTVPPPADLLRNEAKRQRTNWMLAAFAALVLAAVGVAWWRNLRTAETRSSPSRDALTRLTSDSGLTSFPAVSPDGTLVAYASDRGGEGNLDIWVQQLAGGGEPLRLTRGKADEYEPTFSPDGSRIAFRSEADGGGLYLISALGGEPRRLVQSGRSARFSPDGRSLLFAIGSAGVGGAFTTGVSAIYRVGVDGGEPRRLVPDFVSALHPNWTADGKHILFLGSRTAGPIGFDLWALPAAGGPPVATGSVKALRAQGFNGTPEPFAVQGDSVILSLRIGDSSNLWRLRLAQNPIRMAGPVEQLTHGTGLERLPSVSRDGKIVFSAGQENSDLWELSLDANRGEPKGEARQLTHDAADDFFPSLAANGSRVAFISRRGGNDDVWTIDTATGRALPLLTTPAAEYYPKLSRDGALAVFGSMSADRQSMFMMSTSSGVATRLCDDCGVVRDLSADGTKVLMQVGPPSHIGLMDVESRKVTPLYRHPKFPTYAPKLSADEKWTAFQTVEQPTTRTMYVAPFRITGGPVGDEEWIKVSNGRFLDRNPVWSPDGGLLYFLSERDSFRCIWAQRLNSGTHQAAGEPFAVAHFHNAVRSLMNIDGPGQIGVSVGPDRLVYAAGELKGNIWWGQLR